MLKKTLSNLDRNVVSTIQSLVLALAFSPWLIIIYSYIANFVSALDPKDQDTIRGFIEWFGTAYSLFLALVLVNVWAQFETLDREFDREVDALATLYHTVKYTHSPDNVDQEKKDYVSRIRNSIIDNIKLYIEHVIVNYSKEHLVLEQKRNGDIFLENILGNITSFAINQSISESLVSQFFESLNEAMDVRGDRISHSKLHTRGIVLAVAYIASAVWLVSFFGLIIYDRTVSVILIGGVTFVIVMVINIIRDLDQPFDGAWQVDMKNWSDLLEIIDPNPNHP